MTHLPGPFAGELRREICARNAEFANARGLRHSLSYGSEPVTVYAPEPDGRAHGNFYPASYRAILRRPDWARRLGKVHTQARTCLPRVERRWKELDSCTSSDALLMNVFCCPGVCNRRLVAGLLGTETENTPEFGYRARVPLKPLSRDSQTPQCKDPKPRVDRTEIDMRLGLLLVEAKLTETDFQAASASLVENYRDLEEVFEVESIPRAKGNYLSYQLIRNVLAAHAFGLNICVMLDARRPDLLEAWHVIMRCVRSAELRTRCKVLTWQEISPVLPSRLQRFLQLKYGIAAE
jgi:hypothetical protein